MTPRRALLHGLLLLMSSLTAAAQPRPIFDADDYVDPGQHAGPVFISSLAAGAAANFIDDYRPLHHGAAFVQLTNRVYWSRFQFDYKHSEVRGGHSPDVFLCGCSQRPIYFPTPPAADATPSAPPAGSKDTLQFAWYAPPRGSERPPLRYRLSWSRQPIDTVIRSFANVVERRKGQEQTLGLDADTHFRIGSRDVYGSLLYARNVRSGTTQNRTQQELAYMSRFPAWALKGNVLVRATLTLGGVSGRGATGLNVVNPALEAFLHESKTQANFHLIWSPLATRSGANGWETHRQIALYVDRKLYIKLFQ